ncbi:MAG: rod shape-determining protein [Chloroflexi bacterium HGW-Chloroflexi-10]|jgi:rod shape-determining protein MreB|nr:MAG: rod shape-determining protein [Chloroflexi bacterium HGW-Chloroflexi-10]
MALFSREYGFDFGTMNSVIVEGSQVVVMEPTVGAVVVSENKMVEWGQAARDMLGRVSDSIEVVRPLQHGVLAEFHVAEQLVQEMVRKAGTSRLFPPRIAITAPYGVTSVERRAVEEVALTASREVYFITQPVAAALGIDLPIGTPSGNMVISLGGGTNQAAVLAMWDVVTGMTAKTGGLSFDEAIISYVRKKFGVIIGQPTAEKLKISIGAAISEDETKSMEVQGQDQVSGLPKPVLITTEDIVDALEQPLNDLVTLVRHVLEKTPPELISDIIDRGVALCGGGALLTGIDKYLTKALGIPAYLVDNPMTCTAEGAAKALTMRNVLKRSLIKV